MQNPKSPFLIRMMPPLGARTPSGAPLSSAPSRTASIQASTRYCFASSHFINLKSKYGDLFASQAILVGKVGQQPVQKFLRSGHAVVLFSLGTGGIRNNRRPLDNEEPRDYANRCSVQWHRVSVYPDRLGNLALKHVKPGLVEVNFI